MTTMAVTEKTKERIMDHNKVLVLSIDDSKSVHAFLDRCLRETKADIEFIHSLSVKEGLEVLKQNKFVRAILLDWEMPEISGYEGLPLLLAVNPEVPVIVATSKNNPSDILSMLDRGAKEYMMKPFTPDILIEKINSVLNQEAMN